MKYYLVATLLISLNLFAQSSVMGPSTMGQQTNPNSGPLDGQASQVEGQPDATQNSTGQGSGVSPRSMEGKKESKGKIMKGPYDRDGNYQGSRRVQD